MRARVPSAVLALALAATSLSACRTNAGAAAKVGGERISETSVNDYLSPSGPSTEFLDQLQGATYSARAFVLTYEVRRTLYRSVLSRNGGLPSAGQLSAQRSAALQLLAGGQITDAQLRSGLSVRGVRTSFVPVLLETSELEAVLRQTTTAKQAQISRDLRATTVRVSPRYGRWDATQRYVDRAAARRAT